MEQLSLRKIACKNRYLLIGVCLGILFYIFDSFIDPVINNETTFIQELINPEPIEIWIRSFVFFLFIVFGLYVHVMEKKRKKVEEEREQLVNQLQDTLAHLKVLRGMLPICASCKKIRDDKGYWNQIESYIREHSEAEFSHGICPDCAKKLYPDYCKNNE